MPMLHGCAFPDCTTFTLSTYCIEHELIVRAMKETERSHAPHPLELDEDAPLTVALGDETPEPAQL